jgi:cell shape-determining protein MreC
VRRLSVGGKAALFSGILCAAVVAAGLASWGKFRDRYEAHRAEQERKQIREKVEYYEEALKRLLGQRPILGGTPSIDAGVTSADLDSSRVILSAGRKQGVKSGFQFTVFRGDRIIGKVQVVEVQERRAAARVLFTAEDERIQTGDRAATQL